jgi:integrase
VVQGGRLDTFPVWTFAEAVQPRYRALVLLGAFCGLRWGELRMGLRRQDLDTERTEIRVRGSVSELNSGKRVYKAPKSEAGKRTVSISASIMPTPATPWPPGPTPARGS